MLDPLTAIVTGGYPPVASCHYCWYPLRALAVPLNSISGTGSAFGQVLPDGPKFGLFRYSSTPDFVPDDEEEVQVLEHVLKSKREKSVPALCA